MLSVQLSFYAMAIALSSFAAILVWRFPTRPTYFVVFLVLSSIVFLAEWMMAFTSAPSNAFWLALLMILSFTFAPCALFLAQRLASSEAVINWRGHWALIVSGWFFLLPLLLILLVKPLPDFR